ncbi:E3 ubiquitin-protein ligase KCMF1 [Drosophila willistoni]|uniref:E3 ubiquitin-protein ligase KCMF1 n=1 Tax=Drosophila willistoni TaxID=7260 RepID=UPI00017D8880|nr:E3 ubiquitin-protein ligase KCMF1 [Drosophila willistoni]XP_046868387.1 E3 ubiquitin-protein ligase KCMF1 [Drosophila willistoni]
MASHWNVHCNGCGSGNLVHYRYKCLRCEDFDLCADCHENKVETGDHKSTHPFQCLLDRAARELFFAGEPIPELCAESFTCPICGEMGHTRKDLIKHAQSKHQGDCTAVICPLCVTLASTHPEWVINIVGHLNLHHGEGILRMSSLSGAAGTNAGTSGGSGAAGGGGGTFGTSPFSLNSTGRTSGFSGTGSGGGTVATDGFQYRTISSPSILRTSGAHGNANNSSSSGLSGTASVNVADAPQSHHVQIVEGPQPTEAPAQRVRVLMIPPHAESEDLTDSEVYEDSD